MAKETIDPQALANDSKDLHEQTERLICEMQKFCEKYKTIHLIGEEVRRGVEDECIERIQFTIARLFATQELFSYCEQMGREATEPEQKIVPQFK